MRFYTIMIAIWAILVIVSLSGTAGAASIEVSSGVSSYDGHTSPNTSITLVNDMKGDYKYTLSMSKEVEYSTTSIRGDLKIEDSIEVNQLSMGIRKYFKDNTGVFFAPELGVALSIVDLTTKASYNNKGTEVGKYIPIDLSLTINQSKSYILPYASVIAGKYITDNAYVYLKYKYSGYDVKGVGVAVSF